MKKIRRFLITSSLLVLQFVAAPLSANAQVVWVHRKYYPPTKDHLYTIDVNEGSQYSLEAANYFGLAPNDSGGSWWALDRYFNFYVTPAQHFYVGAWSTSPKSDLPNLKFEGTLGYYYPYQAYNTCTFSYFINCIPNCNELQCPPPPGLRPLYSLTYFGDTDTGKRHYLLTTNKAERDHLLVTEAYKWQCSIGTASERIPTTLNESACVLGFVY